MTSDDAYRKASSNFATISRLLRIEQTGQLTEEWGFILYGHKATEYWHLTGMGDVLDRRKISDRRSYPKDDIPPLCLLEMVFIRERRIMPDRRRNKIQDHKASIQKYTQKTRDKN